MARFARRCSVVVVLAGVILPLVGVVGCGGVQGPSDDAADKAAGAEDGVNVLTNTPEITGLIKAEDPDLVVATVNGDPITAGAVTELAQTNKVRMRAQGITLPEGTDPQLMRAALEVLINAELMVQQARAEGIQLPTEEIEAEVQAARAQFASEEEYATYLENAGLSAEDVKREAERRVLMKAYQALVVKGQRVDEETARKVYDANPEQFTEGEQVRAAQILVRCSREDPQAKRDEAKKRIEEAHARLTEGADFAALAKEYSQAATAAKGGDLGFFPRGVMVPIFEEVAFRTEVGKISPVFETLYGFNIIKVLDKQPPVLKPFAEVKPWLMVELARQQEGQVLQAKLIELRDASKIEILDESLQEEPQPEPGADAGAAAATQ
jgi:parvulin-like peptidyl-prolyl isomerase